MDILCSGQHRVNILASRRPAPGGHRHSESSHLIIADQLVNMISVQSSSHQFNDQLFVALPSPSVPWFSHPDDPGLIKRSEVEIRRTGPCHYSAHNPNTVLGICDSLDQWLATEMRQETPSVNKRHLALATNFIQIRIGHLMLRTCLPPFICSCKRMI